MSMQYSPDSTSFPLEDKGFPVIPRIPKRYRFCPECGRDNDGINNYCPNCGSCLKNPSGSNNHLGDYFSKKERVLF